MSTKESDWETKRLGDIGEVVIGLTYSPRDIDSRGTLVLRSSNIQGGQLDLSDSVRVRTHIPEDLRVRVGDILVCVRNGSRTLIGKSLYLDQRVEGESFGAFMAVYRSKYNDYLRFFFQSEDLKRQVDAHLGATINQITNRSLRSFETLVPPAQERCLVAAALGDAEEYVRSLERMVAKKRAIKQGIMQELLTGKRRLSGFSRPWAERQVAELAVITKGVQLGRAQMDESCSIPVWNGGIEPSGYTSKPNLTRAVVTVSEGGNSCGWVGRPNGAFWLGGHCYALDPKTDGHSVAFLFHLLKAIEQRIMALRVGSGLPNIQKKRLSELVVAVPTDASEAIQIAALLDDVDCELESLAVRLDKARKVKVGMMQELLTGRTRLVAQEVSA